MGICTGCGQNFPRCTSSTCCKCVKLEGATTDIDRERIKKLPQCRTCSVVYPHLQTAECGVCSQQQGDTQALSQSILESAMALRDTASTYRLNQEPSKKQNAALQNATAIKSKVSTLQKQNKAEMYTVLMALYYFPLGGGAMKKAQLMPIQDLWNGSTPAAEVLVKMKDKIKDAHFATPARADLNFDNVAFGVNYTAKTVNMLEMTEPYIGGTLATMFSALKNKGRICDSDSKSRMLSLRLAAYENSVDESDGELGTTLQSKGRRPAKRRLSEAMPYVSAYQPRKLSSRLSFANTLVYDTYTFKRIHYTTDEHGNLLEHNDLVNEEKIEVAKDWQKYRRGDKPCGGYISKGFTKFAFEGRINGMKFAIFQSKPTGATASENAVYLIAELRLLASADYFAKSFKARADAFGFKLPGSGLRWNAANAFVGEVTTEIPQEGPDGTPDTRSLLFAHFLAAPFIERTALDKEYKFSGNNQAGNNKDDIGKVVDAFAHHVFVDSHGSLILTDIQGIVKADKSIILFDPQAHSSDQSSGYWDNGIIGMQTWLRDHKCNTVCQKLNLDKEQVDIHVPEPLEEKPLPSPVYSPRKQQPLRIGFPSAKPT